MRPHIQSATMKAAAAPAAPLFLGRNPLVLELLETACHAAATDAPVLITGESGTGKEILARIVHANSPRSSGSFVTVNCGAITGTLEESELFGHLAGAFTGAERRKQGRFEAAEGGTIFLDEIGETSPSLQVKLLRVLQDGEYSPVGSATNRHCDVRVVAATNRRLPAAIAEGQFRPDLYYRLDVIRLNVPPLRDRPDDIPLLARFFAERFARKYGFPTPRIETGFLRRLLDHDYPGNVRELGNYLQRAVIMSRGDSLTAVLLADIEAIRLPASDQGAPAPGPAASGASLDAPAQPPSLASFHEAKRRVIEKFEREYLIAALTECGGIVYRAAERAGMSERGFHLKLRQHGIDGTSFRAGA